MEIDAWNAFIGMCLYVGICITIWLLTKLFGEYEPNEKQKDRDKDKDKGKRVETNGEEPK